MPGPAPDPSIPDACVLVVEDDQPVREMACHLLRGAGYRVADVGSAEEALELGDDAFDVLFCDVMLPGATGVDLAARLRSQRPDLPILLTSGQRDAGLRETIERAGHPFLPKPYTADALRGASSERIYIRTSPHPRVAVTVVGRSRRRDDPDGDEVVDLWHEIAHPRPVVDRPTS